MAWEGEKPGDGRRFLGDGNGTCNRRVGATPCVALRCGGAIMIRRAFQNRRAAVVGGSANGGRHARFRQRRETHGVAPTRRRQVS